MRDWKTLCFSMFVAAAAAFMPGQSQAADPIRIGVLLPLTGPFAKNGIENWEAMQIARDMIYERGGVNGR
jgi:branched-chain amino acid transport system substrate-binding protein